MYHPGTVAFAWCRPVSDLREGIDARYHEMGEILVEALGALGVDARMGEIPGEYCPGRYSVNAGGRVKLAGVGQRVVRGAAHVGGVIVVSDAGRVNRALAPVYAALGLDMREAATGAIEDEVADVTTGRLVDALAEAFGRRFRLEDGALDAATLDRARQLAPEHDPEGSHRPAAGRPLAGVVKGVME